MAQLKAEDMGVLVISRLHAVGMVHCQQDLTARAGIIHSVGLIHDVPRREPRGDRMLRVGDFDVQRLVGVIAERAVLDAHDLVPHRPFAIRQTAVVQNNDALAQMLSTVGVVLLAWTCFRGLPPARVGGLILAISLSLLTKRTTLFLIPLMLLVLSVAGTQLVTPLSGDSKRHPYG